MHSVRFPFAITAALMSLLVITVGASFVNLGAFNTAVAMLISALKATLILLFFMRLRTASPLLRLFAGVGFFWLGILITLTLSDVMTRHP
jgi:cytochrome c oxidase subunit 4